jgi:hypothetical protein
VRASIVAAKHTGMSFGALVFSFFTLMMINVIVILPMGLVIQDFFRSLG